MPDGSTICPKTVPHDASVANTGQAWQPNQEFNQQYRQWLLGNEVDEASPYVEKTILQALDRLKQSESGASQLLPRVPTVLLNVLKSLRDTNVSANELAQQISKDTLLVGELLHEVNGAYFNLSSRVSSLDSAIQLLGLNGLRMLIARTAFRPIIQMQSGKLAKELAPRIWAHSEKNSLACQLLAKHKNLDPFHAFLTGLLYDVGLIVAFRLVDQTGVTDTLPSSTAFQDIFFNLTPHLSIQVGRKWEFPEPVLQAILENTTEATSDQNSALGNCLRQAEQIARLRLLMDHGVITTTDGLALLEGDSVLSECLQQLQQTSS